MFVAEKNRLPGFENETYYHPLFLYESLLMLLIGGGLWLLVKRYDFFKVGNGVLTLSYFALYGWVRFFLEFLRVDKAVVAESILGVNQLLVLIVALAATFVLLKKIYKGKHA
jgi:phosphatidylglycerol:prolipoprotein diacylglycerol transferase